MKRAHLLRYKLGMCRSDVIAYRHIWIPQEKDIKRSKLFFDNYCEKLLLLLNMHIILAKELDALADKSSIGCTMTTGMEVLESHLHVLIVE